MTRDAGVESLTNAINHAMDCRHISIKDTVTTYQIPHHGSRHNVSPTVLNKMIGNIKPENFHSDKVAIASVCSHSDHPRKMVANAFIRRGVKVYATDNGVTISKGYNLSPIADFPICGEKTFSPKVEKWD